MPKQFLVKKPKGKDDLEESVLDQQVPSGIPYSYYHPAFFYNQPEYFSSYLAPTIWNRYPAEMTAWGKGLDATAAAAAYQQQQQGAGGIASSLNLPQPLNLPQQMSAFSNTSYLNNSLFNPTNNPTQQSTTSQQSADVQFQQDFQRYINQQHVNAQLQAQQQAQQQDFTHGYDNDPNGKVKRDLYNEFFDLDSNALKKEDTMLLPNAVAAALSANGRLKRESVSSDDSKCSESSSAAVVDGIINSGLDQGLKVEKDLHSDLSPKDGEEGDKIYQCEYCTKKFSRSWNYQRHVLIHSGRKPHKCDVCQKAFVLAAHLKIHMRIHTGEKPYKCTVCGRGFAQLTNLQRHALTHTGQKPHRCQHCNKGFVSSSDLRRHIRIHTGEKPYKCHACSKAFTTSGNLQSHVLTHTGVKPYSCSICKWKFISSSNLRTHIRTHHNMEENVPNDNLQMVPDTNNGNTVLTPSSDQENPIYLTQTS